MTVISCRATRLPVSNHALIQLVGFTPPADLAQPCRWCSDACNGSDNSTADHTPFGYSGSVLVPDGGTSSLGSYSSASQSGSQSGWLVPRWDTRSASVNSAGASITASIIDHEQMDRELLGQSAAELRNELRRQSPRPRPTMQAIEEGKSLVRYARTLVKQGRYRAARQAYLTALPLLDQRLRELALQEMNRLPSAS